MFVDSFFLSVKKRERKKGVTYMLEQHATSCQVSKICYLFTHTDLKNLLLIGLSTASENTQNRKKKLRISN